MVNNSFNKLLSKLNLCSKCGESIGGEDFDVFFIMGNKICISCIETLVGNLVEHTGKKRNQYRGN